MKQLFSPRVRRWSLVVGTMAAALFSGHVMQRNDSGQLAVMPPPLPANMPRPPAVAMALKPPPIFRERTLETRVDRKDGCEPTLLVTKTPAGHVDIGFNAPCHAQRAIRVHVNHLLADETTDGFGRWRARVPAMHSSMDIQVFFDDKKISKSLTIEGVRPDQLLILAWDGAQIFEVRAEVSQPAAGRDDLRDETPNSPPIMIAKVGDGSGASFEILSFPVGVSGGQSVVRLSVEALVTADNCNREAATVAYQTGYIGVLRPTDIAYTMPTCDRIGQVVRLQNLFRDMRLTQR